MYGHAQSTGTQRSTRRLCTPSLRQASRVQNEGLSIRHSDRSAAACLLVWRTCGFTYGPVKAAAATSEQSFPAPRRQASTRLDKTARRQRANAAAVVLCVRASAIGIKKARRPVPERHDSARASRRRELWNAFVPPAGALSGLLHLAGGKGAAEFPVVRRCSLPGALLKAA